MKQTIAAVLALALVGGSVAQAAKSTNDANAYKPSKAFDRSRQAGVPRYAGDPAPAKQFGLTEEQYQRRKDRGLAKPKGPKQEQPPAARMGTRISPTTWRTRNGLLIDEGTTLQRLLSHAKDDMSQPDHGVFAAGSRLIGALDAAFATMKSTHDWEIESQQGSRRTVTVEVGPNLGWIGGRTGAALGRPVTSHVQMVMDGDKVLDAYPVRIDRMPKVLAANVNVPVRARPQRAAQATMTSLLARRGIPQAVAELASDHIALGMPTDAGRTNDNDYLLARDRSVISYNRGRMSPNWAAWTVTADDAQSLPRPGAFKGNKSLPEGWLRMTERDIKGSGYTRGHLVAAGERGASMEEVKETFTFTNILPQAKNSNSGPWNGLEKYYRGLAKLGATVHVVAGGVYGPKPKLIGRGIPVPEAMWKIVVVVPKGESIDHIGPKTRVIAQLIPNEDHLVGMHDDWGQYRTSVAEIERQTGFDFFANLPKGIGDALKAKTDSGPTGNPLAIAAAEARARGERLVIEGSGRRSRR